jgi:uracil phosphoribosyltransferase
MLHLVDHPLCSHIVTHLRDRTTIPVTFRTLTYQIGILLAIEATRQLPTRPCTIETPLERYEGRVLAQTLVIVPILRAGIGMVQPFTDLFPDVQVGYVGLERDDDTAVARNYYSKLPSLEQKQVLLLDPMLATGGSAVQAIELLKASGARKCTIACVVAAPEGVQAVERVDRQIDIYAAALDRELNDRKYILPGLGDFGDRLYGT